MFEPAAAARNPNSWPESQEEKGFMEGRDGRIDNEFMGKKSSKKCCIFHKDKPFDEDFSDNKGDRPSHKSHGDGYHGHGHGEEGCCSNSDGHSD